MTPDHGDLLYEGKAKRVYAASQPDRVLVEFKNDATAFNAQKKAQLEHKGRLNCLISACLFELLERHEIPTHYRGVSDDTWMVVQRVDVIPIEVVLRNTAAGSLCRETPISQGTALDPALLDLYYKDDDLGDPLINDEHIIAFGWANKEQIEKMKELTYKVNTILKELFINSNLILVDFKVEFGVCSQGKILLADEFTPDGCRLWDSETLKKMDKDRFRQGLGDVVESYHQVADRLGMNIIVD